VSSQEKNQVAQGELERQVLKDRSEAERGHALVGSLFMSPDTGRPPWLQIGRGTILANEQAPPFFYSQSTRTISPMV